MANPNTRSTSSTSGRSTSSRSSASNRSGADARLSERREPQPNVLTHTEFASRDPKATQEFLRTTFGWEFETQQGPTGDYHMFRQENNAGGGVRGLNKAEAPAAIPYIEVEDLNEAERTAKKAGAKVLQPRTEMGDQGATIVLQAPGGPLIGLWGPTRGGRRGGNEEE